MREMQLHEAIRLGAMLKPQNFGEESVPHVHKSCALGAACDALGIVVAHGLDADYAAIQGRYPALYTHEAECPACQDRDVPVSLVWHLNDRHRWTREEIATWLEGIEGQATPVESDHSAALTAVETT